MPLVPLGVFLACLTAFTSPAVSRDLTGLLGLFVFGMAAFGLLWRWTHRRPTNSLPGSAGTLAPRRADLGAIVVIMLLFGLAAAITIGRSRSAAGVSNLACVPVGVSNNLVIVDVKGEVARWGVEVQASLDGPKLSPAAGIALDEEMAWFAGTRVPPTPYVGNRPWRIWSAGPQTWRLGFALPDAALAQEAFANLRPVGPLPAQPRPTFAATLFEVGPPGGERYRASLNVTPPVTSGDPNWVSIANFSRSNESGVTLTWELLASRPGAVRFVRGDNPGVGATRTEPEIRRPADPLGLEALRRDRPGRTDPARRPPCPARHAHRDTRRRARNSTADFRELVDELLRARNQSFKTVRGAEIELCQFQGTPLTVRWRSRPPPSRHPPPRGGSAGGWRSLESSGCASCSGSSRCFGRPCRSSSPSRRRARSFRILVSVSVRRTIRDEYRGHREFPYHPLDAGAPRHRP
jgi:hypothetical protein